MIKNSATYIENSNNLPESISDLRDFERIYKHYWKALFDKAYQKIRSVEKTEEIIQDLFADLWEKRERLDIRVSIAAYLFTALKFRVLNHLRNEMIRTGHLNIIKSDTSFYYNSIDDEIEFKELETLLQAQINKLPEKCREAFILSRYYQLSFKEIAAKLDISVNTVEKHIGKALRLLRNYFKDYIPILILIELFY